MNKILKKFLVSVLIILILFNFVCSIDNKVYADDVEDKIVEISGGIVGFFTWPIRIIAVSVAKAMSFIAAKATSDSSDSITPEDMFFNKVDIVKIDYNSGGDGRINKSVIKTQVAKWYQAMRLIAVAILLLILIYVGIRMTLSTVASDRAVYKKMLVDWTCSIALVFLMHYIIGFAIGLNNIFVGAVETVSKGASIKNAMNQIALKSLGIDLTAIGATIVYCIMCGQTLGFLIMYLKRMITVSFLIIISPLITITYAIDKMGDGKAQALGAWLKEFLVNLFIQPFHCILYVAFANTALGLLGSGADGWEGIGNAFLAIVCIKFVTEGEKIVKSIFGFNSAGSLQDYAASAAVAGIALSKAKDIGKATRQGVNFVKETAKTGRDAIKKDRAARLDKKAQKMVDSGKASSIEDAKKQIQENRGLNRIPGVKDLKYNMEYNKMRRKAKADHKIEGKMREDYANNRTAELMKEDKAKFMEAHKYDANAERKYDHKMSNGGYEKLKNESRKAAYDEFDNKVLPNKDSDVYKQYRDRNTSTARKITGAVGTAGKKVGNAVGTAGKAVGGAVGSAGKAVGGAVKNVYNTGKQAYNNVANSHTGKFVRKLGSQTVSAGVGLALGGMAAGTGMGTFESVALGAALYGASNEFLSTSKNHLALEGESYINNKQFSSKEEVKEHVLDVKSKGDSRAYDENVKNSEINKLLDQLRAVLRSKAGDKNGTMYDNIKTEIQFKVASDPKGFNLDSILSKHLGNNLSKDADIHSAAKGFSDNQYEANLYKTIQNSESTGMSASSLASALAGTVATFAPSGNTTNEQSFENNEGNTTEYSSTEQVEKTETKEINEIREIREQINNVISTESVADFSKYLSSINDLEKVKTIQGEVSQINLKNSSFLAEDAINSIKREIDSKISELEKVQN